jgi:hypothetical protein
MVEASAPDRWTEPPSGRPTTCAAVASLHAVRPVFHDPGPEPGPWATDGPGGGYLRSGDLASGTHLWVNVGHDHNVHVGVFGPEPDWERLGELLARARPSEGQTDRYIGVVVAYDGDWEIATHVHYNGNLRPSPPLADLMQLGRAYIADHRTTS